MGTLRKVKTKMKKDKDLKKTLIRSAKDEILIDIDGDGMPDIALMDSNGDGDIDTLAVNLANEDEFNLYFHKLDSENMPEMVLLDSESDAEVEIMGIDAVMRAKMLIAAHSVFSMMELGDYIAEKLERSFDELQETMESAGKILKSK